MIQINFKKAASATSMLLAFAACSHTPALQEYAATASPTEEIQKLDADLTTAYRAQVDILSPRNYENARVCLKDAKADLDKQKDSAVTLHEVAKGRAYLTQAQAVAQTAHTDMEEVISARQQAIAADAPKHFDKEFHTADKNLREVTEDLEKNDADPIAKNRTKLQNEYLALELLSIKTGALHDAREMINQAVKEGAKTYAPRSLAIAQKTYKDTDAYITANRHNDQVKTKADAAKASADHLLKITRAAKTDKKTSPEELALQMESEQNQVANKQNEIQSKNTELENKDSQLANKDVEIANKEGQLLGKDAELTGAALALSESNKKADSEKAFNEKFETARKQFNENEAEVYKQGNELVIRLKTLEFPKAKADLKASNFALLAKVEKVIKEFGQSPSVIVEGHTDSVGGKAVNEKISTQRAEAVKEYFVANQATEPSKIKAIGYDYQKPLASNKTASGRAQNRRVDIRIQADRSTSL
jgi:OOP family OmpA-OmpF porin